MISSSVHWAGIVAAGVAAAGCVQAILGLWAARRFVNAKAEGAAARPAVTVLKPLHGAEPMLEQALESFFQQDYPAFQLVFGVQNAADPAIAVVRRLQARHPSVDTVLVINPAAHGHNRKIANLINMFPRARHDLLVISDSDMHVSPDYLRRVSAAFGPGVGLVTTVYAGLIAGAALTDRLGAAYINQIFASGALLARHLGRQDCLGATMALTRGTLARAGGLEGLSPFVADDGVLGRRVRALGLGVALARTVPSTTVAEAGPLGLFAHELRWARTIRAMAPVGFVLSAIQFPMFWAGLALLASGGAAWAEWLALFAWTVRAATGRQTERALGVRPTSALLVPVRDLLSIAVMACAFWDNQVAWRGQILSTEADRALASGRGTEPAYRPALLESTLS